MRKYDQWEHWDATDAYHSNSHHPYCPCCEKYLVIPTEPQRYTAQTCEHYDAYGSDPYTGVVNTNPPGDFAGEM